MQASLRNTRLRDGSRTSTGLPRYCAAWVRKERQSAHTLILTLIFSSGAFRRAPSKKVVERLAARITWHRQKMHPTATAGTTAAVATTCHKHPHRAARSALFTRVDAQHRTEAVTERLSLSGYILCMYVCRAVRY